MSGLGIGRWREIKTVGRGGYGRIVLALDETTGAYFCVKECQDNGPGTRNVKAWKRETECLIKLSENPHPNIVGYYGRDRRPNASGLPATYVFLEYVENGDLGSNLKALKKDRPEGFREEVCKRYTRHLLEGLAYAHENGIIHGDLKCANLLVTRDGVVKLTDFGGSVLYKDPSEQTGKMLEATPTFFWAAPEICSRAGFGRKADIWSLGITVIEMLTGSHPYGSMRPEKVAQEFWSISSNFGPKIPARLSLEARSFVEACLRRNPDDRLDARALLWHPFVFPAPERLSRGVSPLPVEEPESPPSEDWGGSSRRPPIINDEVIIKLVPFDPRCDSSDSDSQSQSGNLTEEWNQPMPSSEGTSPDRIGVMPVAPASTGPSAEGVLSRPWQTGVLEVARELYRQSRAPRSEAADDGAWGRWEEVLEMARETHPRDDTDDLSGSQSDLSEAAKEKAEGSAPRRPSFLNALRTRSGSTSTSPAPAPEPVSGSGSASVRSQEGSPVPKVSSRQRRLPR